MRPANERFILRFYLDGKGEEWVRYLFSPSARRMRSRRETLEHIERLGRDGGYVVASSHSIVDAIPLENYFAMVETAIDNPA